MAETPKKLRPTPRKPVKSPAKTPFPQTPQTLTSPRRSSRFIPSPLSPSQTTSLRTTVNPKTKRSINLGTSKKKLDADDSIKHDDDAFSPTSPDRTDKKKRKNVNEKVGDEFKVRRGKLEGKKRESAKPKRRVYYKKVSYDGGEFSVGDDVYVKRREDASSDDEDPEIEECRVCYKSGKAVMIECDDCLGGFHLKCLKPPLRTVPEGDWLCGYCEAKKSGKSVKLPQAPKGKKRRRTAKEKLLSSDLWAVRIESLWKEIDGSFWFRGRWYVIPEETAAGRQLHNLKRELYRTNDFADNENSRKGHIFGLQKIGTKRIPEHVRTHKQTELEKAKATLLLATLPKSLPCRNKEMEEITAFIKGAICDDQCLGRCLYIHGVPGTGKTMSVLAVMRSLRSEVDAGITKPYSFVEINGLKLAAPENIYRVIYEALTGHRVSWKKALNLLNDKFSNGIKSSKDDDRPCILLIDELDLLVTRNQSVLYNILDWPTKPNSKLIVIGIANTMDLPEKLLPRISSRMGIQRLCFAPYNYLQLQEIIGCRLKGIDAFEKQAIEFASRKVAAVSGDARRALEICRRAAELADYRVKKSTLLPKTDSFAFQVMRSCSKLSKIFLAAMVHELYKTGMSETTFEKIDPW
ncbi:hypothetical protein R6Q59_014785 [Mikania micrantha]